MYREEQIISRWMAEMYDRSEIDMTDVEFALSVIGAAPKRILEIACGSGRMLVPLAKAGHLVTGLDFDEAMLSRIPAKAKGLSNISWKKSDVMKEDWGGGYDAVLLAGNFLFNIVTDRNYEEAQALAIQKSAEALVPGGRFYIDYGYTLHPEEWFDVDGEILVWQGADSSGCKGKMALLENSFDKETGLNRFIRRFELLLPDGTEIKRDVPSVKHFATLEQIYQWLALSGFVLEEEYGDYNRSPIGETTDRAILLARKK